MLFGWQVWADLTDGDSAKLLSDSHAQFYWSFVHSWWVAAFMKALGVTDFAARVSSLAALTVSACVAFWAGAKLYRERVPWAGLIAVALLFMFRSVRDLASQCMIEVPGIMMSFTALLIYMWAEETRGWIRYVVFGCALAGTFLMKYNFGIALIAAFLVVATTEVLFRPWTRYWRNVIPVLVPLALVFMFWFIVPEFRLWEYFRVLVNRPQGPQELGWVYLAYYPRVFFSEVGWWALPWAGVLGLALWNLRERRVTTAVQRGCAIRRADLLSSNEGSSAYLPVVPSVDSLDGICDRVLDGSMVA